MYDLVTIREIKQIMHKWHATNYIQPTFHLLTTLIFIFSALFQINRTTNDAYLRVLIAFLTLNLLRTFMIFHDLTHRSYFPSNERKTGKDGINMHVSRCIDFLCSYESNVWKTIHAEHHRVHGNLNEIDDTRTVYPLSKYNALSKNQKILYNVFRFPPIFFLLGPIYVFGINKFLNREWKYIAKYNLFLTVLYYWGSWRLIKCFAIAHYIAATVGVMLFHLQHQVNVGYWKPFDNVNDYVSRANAELYGSSVLKIPWIIDFFTLGIEYHNIHHFDSRIPGYNTKACYYDLVQRGLIPDNKIGYLQSIKSLSHTIYDEKTELYR